MPYREFKAQEFPRISCNTNVFVTHRRHGSLKLAGDLGSQVSQEIPGYPQAFQESWKFSNGLTQTHRGRVLTGLDGPRRHGNIYSVRLLCVLGAHKWGPQAVWRLFFGVQQLSLRKSCACLVHPHSSKISRKCFQLLFLSTQQEPTRISRLFSSQLSCVHCPPA